MALCGDLYQSLPKSPNKYGKYGYKYNEAQSTYGGERADCHVSHNCSAHLAYTFQNNNECTYVVQQDAQCGLNV